jgi:LCP family protein required for cell wall assembly
VTAIPHPRRSALWRFALAAVVIVGATAAATAVAGLLQVKQFIVYLNRTPPLPPSKNVVVPPPGSPQTLLLIGSDHRAGEPWSAANTDTMMLVRIDPSSSTINLLSIPRDLMVQLPEGGGVVTGKLNAAYSLGGPNLLLSILKQQVFPELATEPVNHIIDINFGGFEKLVDDIGCVYADVDHRYYNNTNLTDYSSIDIQPGYQKLCDANALAFVRFRHTDTDIVRNARQQDFLRWAKQNYSVSQILGNRNKLVQDFGASAQLDGNLHTTDGLINLFDAVVSSAGHPLKSIPFPAILLPCASNAGTGNVAPCYVSADPNLEQQAFHQFMTPTRAPRPAATGSRSGGGSAGRGAPSAAAANLTPDPQDGQAQSKALGNVGFPVYYPNSIAAGSEYCTITNGLCPLEQGAGTGFYPRAYEIHDGNGNAHSSYRMTLVINAMTGQYYGVQGTTWLNPPILNNPSATRMVAGKQLLLYENGGKLSIVAWRTPQAVYWISNTLTDNLPNQQMVAIAASLTR